ncbi:2-deoxy-D-gluconate 3-dehydrogenase [Halomonas sp. S2151]|uniref:SDR family NAD(P)-dependent oxidoreductase n=1 Tax=unclassified Halomonas TaxID=2609666 RepID=UPI0005F9BAAB|nr:SDR family NAD(P)-dependent oxidoreductase [Halomonas sp. S2151]KJZ08020.1 2-deoxy-D-gluconate 3-dehydrogenase [Halomonas sp. S2151]MBR9880629.1 SDR family NAD(P)-dependent oxidoreductase [Gammaproteobacteria bacterium]
MAVLTTFALDGKTALVTGARRGIGAAMALGLAEAGADIIAVSTSMTADGGDLGERVRALGRDCTGIACDLSDRSALMAMVEQLADRRIDILVNNAGTIERAPATEHTDALWDRVIDVNLSAPFVLTREIGRQMVARGSGKVIFTASLLSFQGGITVPGYAASKGGIAQLTKAFANEWAAHGVNVNAVAPGYIATDNTQALRDDPERSRDILARIPAGRWGDAADFKGPVVFLASSASDYMHGSVMTVDGGWMGR